MRSGKNRFLRGLLLFAVLALALGLIAGCGKKKAEGAGAQSTAVSAENGQVDSGKQDTEPEEGSIKIIDGTKDVSEQPDKNEPVGQEEEATEEATEETTEEAGLDENGSYTSKDEVAAYIHEYGHLPDNFITKDEARDLGWDSKAGNLQEVAPGMSIGGDRFGNFEELLPEAKKRKYYECDINYSGGRRGAERIVFSNDGLIFYTGDHYESFEQLY